MNRLNSLEDMLSDFEFDSIDFEESYLDEAIVVARENNDVVITTTTKKSNIKQENGNLVFPIEYTKIVFKDSTIFEEPVILQPNVSIEASVVGTNKRCGFIGKIESDKITIGD